MAETPNEHDFNGDPANKLLEWHIPPEHLMTMNEEQLRQSVIDLNEKVARLYDALMLQVHSQEAGVEPKSQDIEHILRPERMD